MSKARTKEEFINRYKRDYEAKQKARDVKIIELINLDKYKGGF